MAFESCDPFFRTKDERVQTMTDKFFNKVLKTLAGVNDTELNIYLNCKPRLGICCFLPCIPAQKWVPSCIQRA